MPFEVFKRQRAPKAEEPYVTIHRRGTVALNIPAFETLGSPESVEFLYDREGQQMALRASEEGAAHSYRLRQNGTSANSYVVSGTAFFQYYGIPLVPEARRLSAHADNGMLVIDLAQEGAPALPGLPVKTPKGTRKHFPSAIEDS